MPPRPYGEECFAAALTAANRGVLMPRSSLRAALRGTLARDQDRRKSEDFAGFPLAVFAGRCMGPLLAAALTAFSKSVPAIGAQIDFLGCWIQLTLSLCGMRILHGRSH